MKKILVVDDEQSMREFLSIMLKRDDFDVSTSESGDAAIKRLKSGERFSVVLTDLSMPGDANGLDVLSFTKGIDPNCQVVVMTAFASPETAITAIREGAYDYIMKPFKVDEAKVVIRRAFEKFGLIHENLYLRTKLAAEDSFEGFIGNSPSMGFVFDMIDRVAQTKTTVLVTGESGTGKELVSRAIHDRSGLTGKFVAVNCGAIPENLIEAELFGYKKGAFTGAVKDHEGLFKAGEGGTVFLDEIGELPLNAQVRLLRVLQEKKIKPVGGIDEISVDVRIVAATNRDLEIEVEEGRFREDLFYRLNVIPIELPPLRERGNDVRLLIEFFLKKFAEQIGNPIEGVGKEAMNFLMNYPFPGNVRELQNILERAVTLERSNLISMEVLPKSITGRSLDDSVSSVCVTEEGIDMEGIVENLERRWIGQALEITGGNRTEAAKLLGISFRAIRYRLQKYDESSESE